MQSQTPNDVLLTILTSDSSSAKKTKKIMTLLEKDPNVVCVKFVFERTLIHMAILKKIPELVEALAAKYPALLIIPDKNGQLPLHYAVVNGENEKIVETIVSNIEPSFLLAHDKEGKTALHYAVEKDCKSVAHIIASRDRMTLFQEDKKHVTPFAMMMDNPKYLTVINPHTEKELAQFNKVFPPLKRHINVNAIEELQTKLNIDFNVDAGSDLSRSKQPLRSESSTNSPKAEFLTPTTPKRSARKDNLIGDSKSNTSLEKSKSYIDRTDTPNSVTSVPRSTTQDSSETSDVSPASLLDIISNGDLDGLKKYFLQGGDANSVVMNNRPLIMHAFINAASDNTTKSPELRKKQQALFHFMLHHARFDQTDNAGKNIAAKCEDAPARLQERIQVLQTARNYVGKEAAKVSQEHQNQISIAAKEVELSLFKYGLNNQESKTSEPLRSRLQSGIEKDKKTEVEEILLDVCSGFNLEKPGLVRFDKLYVASMVQGLLSKSSPAALLDLLAIHKSTFNRKQALIAYFIAKEIIYWVDQSKLEANASISKALHHFLRTQGPLPKAQNDAIKKSLIHLHAERCSSNLLVVNYQLLNEFLDHPTNRKHLDSFDALLTKLSTASSADKLLLIKKLANEFRALMASIYVNMGINELYNKNWSGENSSVTAPHAIIHAVLINKLTSVISELILKCDPSRQGEFITALILIADYLVKNNHPLGPDLNCSSAIIMSITTGAVPRILKNLNLDPTVKEKLAALDKLFSPADGAKAVKTLSNAFPVVLFDIAQVKKTFTFIEDGNPNLFNKCYILGSQYLDILLLLKHYRLLPYHLHTNLHDILLTKEVMNELELYDLSCKTVAPKLLLHGETFANVYVSISKYVDQGILPVLVYDNKTFETKRAVQGLIYYLQQTLYAKRNGDPADYKKARQLIDKLVKLTEHMHPKHGIKHNYVLNSMYKAKPKPKSTPRHIQAITMNLSKPN